MYIQKPAGTHGTKQIFVNNKDLGFWTATPITAQQYERDDDGELHLVWCNHAGATEETHSDWFGHRQTYLVCNKCEAHQIDGEAYWYNAPEMGLYRDY